MSSKKDLVWHEPDDKVVCLCAIVKPDFDYMRSLAIHITGVAQTSLRFAVSDNIPFRHPLDRRDLSPTSSSFRTIEYRLLPVVGGWQWQPVGEFADYQKFMMTRNYGIVWRERRERTW